MPSPRVRTHQHSHRPHSDCSQGTLPVRVRTVDSRKCRWVTLPRRRVHQTTIRVRIWTTNSPPFTASPRHRARPIDELPSKRKGQAAFLQPDLCQRFELNCSVVGEGGLEPPRPEGHWHLKPARLPFRHSPVTFVIDGFDQRLDDDSTQTLSNHKSARRGPATRSNTIRSKHRVDQKVDARPVFVHHQRRTSVFPTS